MSARVLVWGLLGIIAGLWSALPSPACAQVWIKTGFGRQSGTTDFDLSLEQMGGGRDLKVRSLLKWPVNYVVAGFEAGFAYPAARASDRWLFEGRLDTNLGDARGQMDDRDWISSRSDKLDPTLFAHTKSQTDSFALLSELSVGYRFGRFSERHHLQLDLLAGSRHEYYALAARGAEGEYFDSSNNAYPVAISNDIEAADYTLLHWMPFIGSRVLLQLTPTLRLPISLRVHYLWSQSHDDHLLRDKEAFGRAYGGGLTVSIAPELSVLGPLSIGLSAELTYLVSVRGVLRQRFYGDDPTTPDDERESAIPESDFAVKSLRTQGMLFARLTF